MVAQTVAMMAGALAMRSVVDWVVRWDGHLAVSMVVRWVVSKAGLKAVV